MTRKLITPKDETSDTNLIISLSDIYEQRAVKERELEFYQKELEKLMFKLGMIQQDIGTTNTIIKMIENEQVFDLQDAIREKKTLAELKEENNNENKNE